MGPYSLNLETERSIPPRDTVFNPLDKGKKLEQSPIQTVLWELDLVVHSPERVTTHPGPLNQPPIKSRLKRLQRASYSSKVS